MKTFQLLEHPVFHDKDPFAEPLHVSNTGRVLRFALRPQQEVREHRAPHSPVYIIVVQGEGMFAGADGMEHKYGPNALMIFDADESHTIRSLDHDLVFLAILHETPYYTPGRA
jgi:quercetin dioxygenase-like cupin family protein